ncbi:hypothetical protein BGW37DRAFT_553949 [Umbelopsis sp. PMI_123]|nr:hypothetical protein BGW37DRAFT_553949 [Umbelopsis sp. PMI_123]
MQQQNTGYSYPPLPPPPQIVTQLPSDEDLSKHAPQQAVPEHAPLPTDPPFVAQRKMIEHQLGPICPNGGFHELRMHYTNSTLCFAVLVFPYFCGYQGRRECVCIKCATKFPDIILPEP